MKFPTLIEAIEIIILIGVNLTTGAIVSLVLSLFQGEPLVQMSPHSRLPLPRRYPPDEISNPNRSNRNNHSNRSEPNNWCKCLLIVLSLFQGESLLCTFLCCHLPNASFCKSTLKSSLTFYRSQHNDIL